MFLKNVLCVCERAHGQTQRQTDSPSHSNRICPRPPSVRSFPARVHRERLYTPPKAKNSLSPLLAWLIVGRQPYSSSPANTKKIYPGSGDHRRVDHLYSELKSAQLAVPAQQSPVILCEPGHFHCTVRLDGVSKGTNN